MSEQIAKRIEKELGIDNLAQVLAEKLSGSDLHSLLLSVLKLKIERMETARLIDLSPVTNVCNLDARLFNKIESIAYETASIFESIELSPLGPLGAVSLLTGLDQSNVLSTIRAFECASDPTIGLALECARRRKNIKDKKQTTRLSTTQRVVRFPLPKNPAFTSHFKLFCLVSAGRDLGSFAFETAALAEHIDFYLSFLNHLSAHGFSFNDIEVELSDTRVISHLCSIYKIDQDEIRKTVRANNSESATKILEKYPDIWPQYVTKPQEELAQYNLPKHLLMQLDLIEETVCSQLQEKHNNVKFHFNLHRLTGLGYYHGGPCFHIKMKNNSGDSFAVSDGGMVTWTQTLLANNKERLATSAIGIELLCRMFRIDSTQISAN